MPPQPPAAPHASASARAPPAGVCARSLPPPAVFVVTRSGAKEPVRFDKISDRNSSLAYGLHELVEPVLVAQKVAAGVYKGVTTTELDELAAETSAGMTSLHPDYAVVRVAV